MTEMKYREIRKILLSELKNNPSQNYSFDNLATKLNLDIKLIKKHCTDLEKIKAVTITNEIVSLN